jgi:hypothetical protein
MNIRIRKPRLVIVPFLLFFVFVAIYASVTLARNLPSLALPPISSSEIQALLVIEKPAGPNGYHDYTVSFKYAGRDYGVTYIKDEIPEKFYVLTHSLDGSQPIKGELVESRTYYLTRELLIIAFCVCFTLFMFERKMIRNEN